MSSQERPVVGIVEDSDEDVELYTRVLSTAWDVRRWRTGEEALEVFAAETDLLGGLTALIVDLHLGGLQGDDVVRRVRELPDGQDVSVCLLTSSRREEDRRSGLDSGVDAFLVKPEDAQRLRELPGLLAQIVMRRSARATPPSRSRRR